MEVLVSETGAWRPFVMRVDTPPFDDVRVRQAMRLLVDRQEMVDQALAGQGRVASDMYNPDDPCYPPGLTREQDLDEAKSLLAAAGQSNLEVELVTSQVAGGILEASQVLVQQAKAAGVTINLRRVDPGELFGENYLQWPFTVDYWPQNNQWVQVNLSDLPGGALNETHFNDPEFNKLYAQAVREVDDAKRCELVTEMQRIHFERGGYIIWGFANNLDAHTDKITGFVPDRTGWNLTKYTFKNVSIL
jgi:peptide/nickel transport system substrate-binding protein